jgi:lipopolysaccharide export system permease protein
MKAVGRMLTRMIVIRFIFILVGISVFVITLDAVTYAKEILQLRGNDPSAIAYYAFLRSPGILSTFLPISVLLALLLALTELSYRNETVAMWSAGISPVRMMGMLLPFAFVVGCLYFLINDRAVPAMAPTLREWGIGDYGEKRLKIGERDPIWMRAGSDILRAASANAQATQLEDVIIFRRDNNGLLREQVFAKSAALADGRWQMSDVIIYYRENLKPVKLASLVYSGSMKPAAAGARSGDPEEMSIGDLDYFIENAGFGIRPVWVYQTWWYKRLSLFVTALVMIAICVPLAVRFRRGGGIGTLFAAGVGLGFIFFVVDGISLTMGELGFVAPWMAALAPLLGFAAIAVALTMRTERT